MKNKENKRKFEGMWIPKELYLAKGYSWTEKILIREIDSLDSTEGGCYASNFYFSGILNKAEGTVANLIAKLKKNGIINIVESSKGGRGLKVSSNFFKSLHENVKDVHENVKKSSRKREHINKEINTVNLTLNEIENEAIEDAVIIQPLLSDERKEVKEKTSGKKEKDPLFTMMNAIKSISNFLEDNPGNRERINELAKRKFTTDQLADLVTKMCAYYYSIQPYIVEKFIDRPDTSISKLVYWACNERKAKEMEKATKRKFAGRRHTKATGAKLSTEYKEAMQKGREVFESLGLREDGEWRKFMKNKN